MQDPKDPLDSLLDKWGRSTPGPDRMESEVWRRIAVTDPAGEPGFLDRVKVLFARPSFSMAFGTACILFVLFLAELQFSHREAQRNALLLQGYLKLVDPLFQANTDPSTTAKSESLEALLAWMKSDLQLTDLQLARIRSVHEQFGPHLLSLATKVAQMQKEMSEFEHARQSVGQIDFLEFAKYVEQRRTLDRECNESTRRLIAESTELMTPQQRQQYLQLMDPALKTAASSSL